MKFIVCSMMFFAGVCSWLILRRHDLPRLARLSLLLNPLLLLPAVGAFSYARISEFFLNSRTDGLLEILEQTCDPASGIPPEKVSAILLQENRSLQEMIAELENLRKESLADNSAQALKKPSE